MNFLKISKCLLRNTCFSNVHQKLSLRTLFSSETLGLTTYKKNYEDARHNVDGQEQFKWELKAYLQNEKEPEITDIKNGVEVLVHLLKPNTDDTELLRDSLYVLNSSEDVTNKAKHSIGNLVMKAMHSLNMPEDATKFYNDSNLIEFFSGFQCAHLYMDLLYENGKYEEIINVDKKLRQDLREKRTNFSKFIDVLVFGACYKLNTAQSFDYANGLWEELRETAQFKKTVLFFGALALKQQRPSIALVALQPMEKYSVCEQLKMLALTDLHMFNEIFDSLKIWLADETLIQRKLSKDVLETIMRSMEQFGSDEFQRRFALIYDRLITNKHVTDTTIEEILNRPISARVVVRGKRAKNDDSQTESSYNLR